MKTPAILLALTLALPCAASLCAADPSHASSAGEYDLSELDVLPKQLSAARPRYPAELKKQRVSGEALIQFVVDQNGQVTGLQVLRSTNEQFAQSASEAVAKWHFSPAQKDGKIVACRMVVPIVFQP
jgi:TonB family protein